MIEVLVTADRGVKVRNGDKWVRFRLDAFTLLHELRGNAEKVSISQRYSYAEVEAELGGVEVRINVSYMGECYAIEVFRIELGKWVQVFKFEGGA